MNFTDKKDKSTVSKVAIGGMLIALTTLATMIISIPIVVGYINLGDATVHLSYLILGPLGGFFAGGIGSALADVFLGYTAYAPFTFLVKGIEGFVGYFFYKKLFKEKNLTISLIIGGIFMAAGYLLVDTFLFSFSQAIVAFPLNLLQGVIGAVVSGLIYKSIGSRI